LQVGGPILTAISTLYTLKGPCSHTSIHNVCARTSLSTRDLLQDTHSVYTLKVTPSFGTLNQKYICGVFSVFTELEGFFREPEAYYRSGRLFV